MKVKYNELKLHIQETLLGEGLDEYSAQATAECMVMADLYGIVTHGSVVLPSHIKRIQTSGYNLSPSFKVVNETASFAVIDANNSIGFASASYSMQYAIEHSKKSGIFSVFSRNANAYGAASCYAMMACKENLIGITFCNSPTAMAPIGGKDKLFGTNPLSVVIPTGDDHPIIIDMATSKVAKSRFLQMKREGKPLGEGWALDKNGVPTTDPDEGIQGLVCPMEGFKGYGLALVIDVLAGLLSGAAWQNSVKRFYNETGDPMNVGHFFMVIDPEKVMGKIYWTLIKNYVDNIRNSSRVAEDTPIAVPGDDKHFAKSKNTIDGIEIADTTAEALGLI